MINEINWDKMNNLIPTVIQNAITGQVLMLGYMNQDALSKTLETKTITFYSRSKQRLWTKGEKSGNTLKLEKIVSDCDNDSLLILATPLGPTCHKNTISCFNKNDIDNWQMLYELEKIIKERDQSRPDSSYTAKLLQEGINKVVQKVGEEAMETIIAALNESDKNLCKEISDLLYHLLVLLRIRDISFSQVLDILKSRVSVADFQ